MLVKLALLFIQSFVFISKLSCGLYTFGFYYLLLGAQDDGCFRGEDSDFDDGDDGWVGEDDGWNDDDGWSDDDG